MWAQIIPCNNKNTQKNIKKHKKSKNNCSSHDFLAKLNSTIFASLFCTKTMFLIECYTNKRLSEDMLFWVYCCCVLCVQVLQQGNKLPKFFFNRKNVELSELTQYFLSPKKICKPTKKHTKIK